MRLANVKVLCDKKTADRRWSYGLNVFENYIGELLRYEGIPFAWIDEIGQLSNADTDVLIVALVDDTKETAEQIRLFAEQGGTVISYGGLAKLAVSLNCRQLPLWHAGYALLPDSLGDTRPLRGLQIAPWALQPQEMACQVNQLGTVHMDHPNSEDTCYALQQFQVGKGSIERWAVNIPQTVVIMQQGTSPVLADGIPAPDGTAKLDEDILKADDACAMDWELDRLQTETGQPYYAHPYADLWREACISHLLHSVVKKGLTLPFTGRWPAGTKHIAILSHDSDGNQDIHAESTLDLLQQTRIHSTWCMLEPGYSPAIYDRVREAGHELAFHYNSVVREKKEWGKESFDRQHSWFKGATGESFAVSNKNHYTRFEGWGELFAWCEDNGIRSDQSRGPSKRGNVGFLFGTCQPYFPIAWADERNRTYDVVEIGFLTPDLGLDAWADHSVIRPFLEQVIVADGVAHFLFHQTHIHNKEAVRDAFRILVETAEELDFTFWTGQQVNDWVRSRRNTSIQGMDSAGRILLRGEAPEGLIVYLPVQDEQSEEVVYPFGIPCKRATYTTK